MAEQDIVITIRGPRKSGKTSIAKVIESQLRTYFGRRVKLVDQRGGGEKECYLFDAENRLRTAANERSVTIQVR